jgi:hypothetical protein
VIISIVVGASAIWDRAHSAPDEFGRSSAPAELSNAARATSFLSFLKDHENQRVLLHIHCSNPAPAGMASTAACIPDDSLNSIDIRPSGFGQSARTVVSFDNNNADVTLARDRYLGITVDGGIQRAKSCKHLAIYNEVRPSGQPVTLTSASLQRYR